MKLRELLTAGVATVALTGIASANDVTIASFEDDGDANTVTTFPAAGIAIASEQTGAFAGATTVVDVEPAAGGTYPDTNLLVVYTLTGATFATVPALAGNNCTLAASSISSGGGVGSSTVTFLIQGAADCTGATGGALNETLRITADLAVANGSAVSVEANVTTELGTSVGGGAGTDNLLVWSPAFSIAATDDGIEAQLPSFTALTAGGDAGDVTLAETAGTQYLLDLSGDTDFAATAANDSVTYEISGDFTGIDDINGTAPVGGTVTITNAGPAAGATNFIFNEEGTIAILGGAYTVNTTLTLGNGFSDVTDSDTFNIGREGTNILFVDTLDNTLTTQFSSTNRYRIANRGDTATGAVSIQLVSWDNMPTATGVQSLTGSIPANGDYVFGPAEVEAIFGAYGVGDFIVTVESAAANLESSYTQISNGGVTNFATQELP